MTEQHGENLPPTVSASADKVQDPTLSGPQSSLRPKSNHAHRVTRWTTIL